MKSARLLCLLVAGCAFGHPGREQLGDEAWHAARWGDAVEDYRAAGDSPRVLAKLADASFQAGLLAESAQAWVQLGRAEPGRIGEAAAGLARVAHQAEETGAQPAWSQAMQGLQQLVPGWPLGRMAPWADRPGDLTADAAVDVMPALLAASNRDADGPMLVALGGAERTKGDCAAAVPIFAGVVHRHPEGELHDSASVALSHCELMLGQAALLGTHPGEAERWFTQAMQIDSTSPVGRRARIGFGDARVLEGDTASARIAWLGVVVSAAGTDSLSQIAGRRLQRLPVPPTDTGATHVPRS